MLQRIQTIYLLIIATLTGLMLILPLAVLQRVNDYFTFDVFGIKPVEAGAEYLHSTWGLVVLTALIAILALVTIFLYKKRMLQIRFCIFNAILMVCFYGLFAYVILSVKQDMDISVSIRIALSFPIICLILDYLAIRSIGADEVLVRSLDRLR